MRYIKLSLALAFSLLFPLMMHAQQELYIYQHSGVTDTLQMSDVANISHSRINLQGERQNDYVVMAIKLNNDQMRQYLLAHWDEFKKNYVGTGARYVTMERLRAYFRL